VIGNVLIAEKKLPSFPLNHRLTDRFIAKTAGRKREPKGSKDRKFWQKPPERRRLFVICYIMNSEVLGTILTSDLFCDKIKQGKDTKIFYLTRENFKEVKREIIKSLKGR